MIRFQDSRHHCFRVYELSIVELQFFSFLPQQSCAESLLIWGYRKSRECVCILQVFSRKDTGEAVDFQLASGCLSSARVAVGRLAPGITGCRLGPESSVCGKSGSANESNVDDWKKHTLASLLREYGADDVYNLDEPAISYKMLPTKTSAAKNTAVRGRKQGKERITILFSTNMCGKHKLPLLAVGKNGKPRCFKNAQLPPRDELIYCHNKKAWVTGAIFEDYVWQLDRKFAATDRNVLFIVDNCLAHGDIPHLKAIRMVFNPLNTTSILQPMDQGVIHHTRKIYCHHLLKLMVLCYDNGKECSIDFLGAICHIVYPWKQVEPTLIMRRFEHAAFSKESTVDADACYSSCALDEKGAESCDHINVLCVEDSESGAVDFAEYLNFENGQQVCYSDFKSEATADATMCDDSDDDDANEASPAPALRYQFP
nr:tigger transposable element-derived protein 4-like [Dermacentor andersoni]